MGSSLTFDREKPEQLEEGALEGQWRDGLCDCWKHFGSCCHVCFCGQLALAQLWTKILGGKMACVLILGIFMFIGMAGATPRSSGGGVTQPLMMEGELEAMIYFILLFVLYKAFIKRYSIPYIGNCQICCQAWWCGPCVVCRMMRHVHNYPATNKDPCCDCTDTGDKPGVNGCCSCMHDTIEAQPVYEAAAAPPVVVTSQVTAEAGQAIELEQKPQPSGFGF